ncbi:MAG: GNAT family N-acetyltransferase [Candidatus Hodarchaeota archaeon]
MSSREKFFRGARSYELYHFFKYAINAEQPNLRFKSLLFAFIFILMLINLLLLGIPRKLILRVLKIIFLEINGEKIGGFLIVDKLKDRSYCHFGGFFIRPKYQGKGFGNIALRRLIEEYGLYKLTLGVDAENDQAVHLYNKYGFKITEILQKYLINLPIEKKEIPKEYTFRSLGFDELNGIAKSIQHIPNSEMIQKDLEEYRRKKKLKNKVITLALKNGIIIGFGLAKWKRNKKIAIFKGSIAIESSKIFPFLLIQVSDTLNNQGITQIEWKRNKKNEFLFNSIKQILNNSKLVSSKFNMEREGTNISNQETYVKLM